MCGMEGLWGSLTFMPAGDVLAYCARKKMDATLRCESGSKEKTLVLRRGDIVRASSNDPREYLGQFLINYGHINEEQLEQAFETQQETKVFLGRILVMIGLVDESVIREVLSLKLRETVLSLLSWEHGQFHLSPECDSDLDTSIEAPITVAEALEEAQARKAAWQCIRQVFPSQSMYLEISPEEIPEEHEHALDARIIELAVQGQTIAEIALSLHATPFALHQRLLALHRAGVLRPFSGEDLGQEDDELPLTEVADEGLDLEVDVELGEEESFVPGTLGEQASVDQIIALARDFLTKGRYAEARAIALRAVEVAPHDDSANSTLKEAETGMLAGLRKKLLEEQWVPRVTAAAEELRSKRFTPAERYLLKRFDGEKTLSAILRVSPIKEVEALKIVNDMASAGVIALDRAA